MTPRLKSFLGFLLIQLVVLPHRLVVLLWVGVLFCVVLASKHLELVFNELFVASDRVGSQFLSGRHHQRLNLGALLNRLAVSFKNGFRGEVLDDFEVLVGPLVGALV